MRADEQNNFGVRVIRAGAIESHPELITLPTSGGANVGMRVVTVDSPGGEDSFCKTILPRSSDVIHDLVAAVLDDRFANARREIIQSPVPGDLFPFAFTAFAHALERIKNAIGILNLVECCR